MKLKLAFILFMSANVYAQNGMFDNATCSDVKEASDVEGKYFILNVISNNKKHKERFERSELKDELKKVNDHYNSKMVHMILKSCKNGDFEAKRISEIVDVFMDGKELKIKKAISDYDKMFKSRINI